MPKLKVEIKDGAIKGVEVLCDTPCGNTRYVAENDNIMNRAGRILEKEIKRCLRSTT